MADQIQPRVSAAHIVLGLAARLAVGCPLIHVDSVRETSKKWLKAE